MQKKFWVPLVASLLLVGCGDDVAQLTYWEQLDVVAEWTDIEFSTTALIDDGASKLSLDLSGKIDSDTKTGQVNINMPLGELMQQAGIYYYDGPDTVSAEAYFNENEIFIGFEVLNLLVESIAGFNLSAVGLEFDYIQLNLIDFGVEFSPTSLFESSNHEELEQLANKYALEFEQSGATYWIELAKDELINLANSIMESDASFVKELFNMSDSQFEDFNQTYEAEVQYFEAEFSEIDMRYDTTFNTNDYNIDFTLDFLATDDYSIKFGLDTNIKKANLSAVTPAEDAVLVGIEDLSSLLFMLMMSGF
ncbi:MAG: hypothetical protein ATN35_08670 [Epulopiscium sp. Nele67-Bin004]|nr:MAG: hypothetical protein ATN35_08670 [Epulopiscium sp. Nele67-Bin004]